MKLKIIEIPIPSALLEQLPKRIDDEGVARDHYLSKEFKVIRGTDYAELIGHDQYGVPDFYVEKNGCGFFVEVKSPDDSLKLHQLRWMLEHSDYEFVLAVVYGKQRFFENLDCEISIERENNPRT